MEQESPSYTEHQRKEGKIPLKGDLKKRVKILPEPSQTLQKAKSSLAQQLRMFLWPAYAFRVK